MSFSQQPRRLSWDARSLGWSMRSPLVLMAGAAGGARAVHAEARRDVRREPERADHHRPRGAVEDDGRLRQGLLGLPLGRVAQEEPVAPADLVLEDLAVAAHRLQHVARLRARVEAEDDDPAAEPLVLVAEGEGRRRLREGAGRRRRGREVVGAAAAVRRAPRREDAAAGVRRRQLHGLGARRRRELGREEVAAQVRAVVVEQRRDGRRARGRRRGGRAPVAERARGRPREVAARERVDEGPAQGRAARGLPGPPAPQLAEAAAVAVAGQRRRRGAVGRAAAEGRRDLGVGLDRPGPLAVQAGAREERRGQGHRRAPTSEGAGTSTTLP